VAKQPEKYEVDLESQHEVEPLGGTEQAESGYADAGAPHVSAPPAKHLHAPSQQRQVQKLNHKNARQQKHLRCLEETQIYDQE